MFTTPLENFSYYDTTPPPTRKLFLLRHCLGSSEFFKTVFWKSGPRYYYYWYLFFNFINSDRNMTYFIPAPPKENCWKRLNQGNSGNGRRNSRGKSTKNWCKKNFDIQNCGWGVARVTYVKICLGLPTKDVGKKPLGSGSKSKTCGIGHLWVDTPSLRYLLV